MTAPYTSVAVNRVAGNGRHTLQWHCFFRGCDAQGWEEAFTKYR
jgi:hypothetical protein